MTGTFGETQWSGLSPMGCYDAWSDWKGKRGGLTRFDATVPYGFVRRSL